MHCPAGWEHHCMKHYNAMLAMRDFVTMNKYVDLHSIYYTSKKCELYIINNFLHLYKIITSYIKHITYKIIFDSF